MSLSPLDMAENVLNHWKVFCTIVAVFLLLGLAYALMAAPVYSSDALVRIEEKKATPLGSLGKVSRAMDVEDSPVLGEIDIVRSRVVVQKAIEAVNAQTTVAVGNAIPLVGRWLGTILPKEPDGLVKPLFGEPFWAWGGESVQFGKFDVPDEMLGKALDLNFVTHDEWQLVDSSGDVLLKGSVGSPAYVGGYHVLVDKVVARPGTSFRVIRYLEQARVEQVQKKLNVAETKRQSGIVEVDYEDNNPIYAARLLNAIVEAYVATNVARRAEESQRSLDVLNRQLPEVKDRLQNAEQALDEFRTRQRTVDVAGEIKSLLDESASVEKSKLDAKMNYQDLLAKNQPGTPLVDAAVAKLGTINERSRQLEARIAALPSVQQKYVRLARDVESNNELYMGLLNNAQQLQIAEASTVGNATIVDPAVPVTKPTGPRRGLALILSTLLGLMFAFAVVQIKALFKGRVRDPARLETALGINTLAVLPLSAQQLAAVKQDKTAFLITRELDQSPLVEAMEGLALALQFSLAKKKQGRVILLTSAVPGQGKSLISANLAWLFAESGRKTLLLDADMRQSTVHRYLSINDKRGLSAVLQGECSADDVIERQSDNLDVIAAGPRGRPATQLFSAARLAPLFEQLRDDYDVVVIDAPPVLPVSDAAALSRYADLTAFVARQDAVNYAEIMEAVSRLERVGTVVDGIVFNGFEPSSLGYGRYGYPYRYMNPA